jgi:Tfp pilus assembly protein PilF
MRARLVPCPATTDSVLVGATHTLMARILRGTLTAAGLSWICFASTLCGCNSVNGYVMNESGKAYYRRGDYTAARHEFERALMDSPENSNYAYNVAAAMQQQGDSMAAEKMYQHALVIDPSHEPSYEGLAHLLYNTERTGEAEQLLTAWSESQPYDENASLSLARMQENMGNTSAADMAYDRALAANPSSGNRALANHYRRSGRRRDAQAYQRGLMQNPYNADMQSDAQLMASGQSPALLMAQQMPLYDPTLQPAAMPFQSFGASPSVPTPPYIGSANLAQQPSPTIYQGTFGPPAGGGMLPPSYQWGTPAAVPLPPAGYGNAMMASQQGPSGGASLTGAQAPAWSAPLASTPSLAPQFAPSQVMPVSGPGMFQPSAVIAQPQVVPAF